MNIREGIISDAHNIALVHTISWQTTYRGIISDDYLNHLDVSQRMKKWEKILSDPDQKVFVALNGKKIIGFITCEKSEELAGHDSKIGSLYLLHDFQNRGIGKKLFEKASEYLKSLGCYSLYILVLKDNPSKGFYEKMGGCYVAEMEVLIGEEKYIEYVYSWKI